MQIAPYVSDRKKKRKRVRTYLFTAIGLLILYGIFFVVQWFIFRSPVFRVDRVVVQGDGVVASSSVIGLVEGSAAPGNNIFLSALTFNNMLLWPDVVPSKELALAPQLANITIKKDYFSHTVTITARARQPFGIWCFSAQGAATLASSTGTNAPCYWFDNTGVIFQKAEPTQGTIVYVVYDSAQNPRGLNQTVLSDEFLPNFISIMNVLKATGLGVQAIELNNLSLEEVDVLTANGPTIYFSLNFPADEYLPVIQKLMAQSNFDTLQYIDCTTQNRLFYK